MGKRRKYKRDKLQWSERKIKQMLIITALLIVPPFILWGISTVIQSNKHYFLGKIGNWTITRPIYRRFLQHTYLNLRLSSSSAEIPPQMVRELTWQKMFYIYLCKKNHISISDEELAKKIQEIPIFQDQNGNFSIDKYRRFLSAVGIQEKDFEESVREDLMIQKLRSKITKGITVSEQEILQRWRDEKEEYHLSFLHIPYKEFFSQINIPEEEIKKYYEKHKEELIIPKKVKIKYIVIPPDKKIPSHQSDLEKLSEELKIPIKESKFITASDILPEIGISQQFYTYAFSLSEGQSSPIFPLEDGKRCIIKVIKIIPKHIGKLTEVKERITEKLKYQKAKSIAKEKAKQLINSSTPIQWEDKIKISPSMRYAPKLGPLAKIVEKLRQINSDSTKDKKKTCIIEQPTAILLIKINQFTPAPSSIPEKEKKRIREQILLEKQAQAFQKYIEEMMEKTVILRKDEEK